jgi:hypothetical protein
MTIEFLHPTRCKRLTSPEIRHDERQRLVPAPARPVLHLLRVTDFMHLLHAP